MKEITLKSGEKTIVDDCSFGYLSKFKWQKSVHNGCIYARRSFRKFGRTFTVLMHREIINTDKSIDHIDGNGLNNSYKNLRECSHTQNMQNRRKHIFKTSKYKGVSWKKGHNKFEANIRVHGTLIPLGRFNSEIEAAETYNLAAQLFFHKFSRINQL